MTTRADTADELMLGAGAVAVGSLTVGWIIAMMLRTASRLEQRRYLREVNA